LKVWSGVWLILPILLMSPFPSDARTQGKARHTVNRVIIHAIGGPYCKDGSVVYSTADGDARRWIGFFNRHKVLGIHYVIDKSGHAEAGVPENQVANHARGNNADTIGIELVNRGDGKDPYPDLQLGMLVAALRSITKRWGIDKKSILAHSAVDDRTFLCGGREVKTKQDPGPAFPWKRVLEAIR
jgi:N-acetylmuramoyl-L-alanine amidase